MSTNYFIADYANAEHATAVVELLDNYAQDPMGGAEPLNADVKANLIEALAQVHGAFSMLCEKDDQYVGLANCFMGFSTFAAKPLVNIHDLAVFEAVRGQGLGLGLLAAVETEARRRGCCKVTLEVLEGNAIARAAYKKSGFTPFVLDDDTGNALLLQKKLM